ncbi:hypothetical protein [Streptomyces puniciscabiei]|uniref:hypothetical protein n=1 Tax=Streptomyces puniciscabiei TaxID=164348 RepID=UPI00331B9EEA
MAVRMSWAWGVDGMAGADFASVDEAATALAEGVERAASHFGTERQQEVVRLCVIPMSDRMRTEGVRVLAEGRGWFGECQGLFVRMNPGQDDRGESGSGHSFSVSPVSSAVRVIRASGMLPYSPIQRVYLRRPVSSLFHQPCWTGRPPEVRSRG